MIRGGRGFSTSWNPLFVVRDRTRGDLKKQQRYLLRRFYEE